MKFSICIPNYNYEAYLGKTLDSVISSTYKNFEIVVSDNASTDKSVALIDTYRAAHANILLHINSSNLGFSANLDCAASSTSGERIIMLSSDDIMSAEAIETYESIIKRNPQAIVSSSWDIIDSQGKLIGYNGPNVDLWRKEDQDHVLSQELGCPVFRVKADVLLKRCLQHMATPFNFCTVTYTKEWYHKVGGYGGGRAINPDKWFHWKLLTVSQEAIFVDKALFQYRWHNQNQTALQMQSGYLKYLTDEYRNVIEVNSNMLSLAGLSSLEIEKSFIKRDVYRHGIGEFTKGRWLKSLRTYFFGLACFPKHMMLNLYFIPYSLILLTTPIGSKLISLILRKKQ